MKFGSKKKAFVILVGVVLSIAGVGYSSSQLQQQNLETQEKQKSLEDYLADLGNTEKRIADHYSNGQYDFIKSSLNEKEIETSKKKFVYLKEKSMEYEKEEPYPSLKERIGDMNALLMDISAKWNSEVAINSLFKEKAILNDTVKQDIPIIDDLTTEQITKITLDRSVLKKGKWLESAEALLKNATEQLDQIKSATEKVNSFYEGEEVIANPTKEEYETVKSEVAKIKNEKAKKQLADKLVVVLDKIEKTEQLALEQEQESEEKADLREMGVQNQETESTSDVAVAETQVNAPLIVTPEETGETGETNGDYSSNAGYNESAGGTSTPSAPPKESSTSNSNRENAQWENTDAITGGDSYGGIYDNLENIPGLEIGNPDWD